ncbi:PAS domain-containing protein [Devosia rhizoryzae]|uniref:Blue-light-activated histidine kinase n=1 Tax=Devosia rhizoryzae TaxID=2774137 RepID=A0ABX7C579_9HYPH|nr:PAS domain-containing protein [Devosia rhizoryzae]QQR37902.1 PAS domain-containing protein [Devosia rhizoryzae]
MPKTLFPQATAEEGARFELDPTIKLFNEFDWSKTELGPLSGWSSSVISAVRNMMVATTPTVMLIGPHGILLYNTGYAVFAGPKHPQIFGQPAVEAWPEVADFNRENIERGLRGEGKSMLGQELRLNRHGSLETVWLDLHYSPVLDEAGSPVGTICVVIDVTVRVMAEQALARSEERLSMAVSGTNLVGTWDWDVLNNRVTSDASFAELYGIDPDQAVRGLPIEEFFKGIHPDDVERVNREIQTVLADGSPFHSEYRIVTEAGVVWVLASGRPRLNAQSKAVRFPGVSVNITEQKQVSEALSASELRFRTLADTMPQMVWSTLPDGYHDYYNARWYEFTGVPEGTTDGKGWNNVFHPDDQERAWSVWRESLETGKPYQIEYRLRHHSGQYRWTLGRALPIRDAQGRILRWIGTCTDIHESRQAANERELVAQELSHRIKNIFAVLTGIISLSARNHPEARSFADQLRQRVFALGEAHDFVRPHSHLSGSRDGQGMLSALVDRLMRAYGQEDEQRVVFAGDDIAIDDATATPLALLFHELATNAAKYGALSSDDGMVVITGAEGDDDYRLTWRERGGPSVTQPAKLSGFGTRLVQMSVEGQMRGKVERHWLPEGLVVEVTMPKDALSRSSRLRSLPEV